MTTLITLTIMAGLFALATLIADYWPERGRR